MTSTILVVVLMASSLVGNPTGVAMQEFKSYDSCVAAGRKVLKMTSRAKYICVKQ